MLTLKVLLVEEYYDEEKEEFISPVEVEIDLEHSLVSLSKWESKHERLFLGREEKSTEDIKSYIECMIVTPFVPPDIVDKFSEENMVAVNEYIEAKMTGTFFPNEPKNQPPPREQISSELVYYWLTSYQIPWEAERWHLNRLFTLIKVFDAKSKPPKKMSRQEQAAQRRKINEERLKKYGTNG